MLSNVFLKTLRDMRRGLIGWSLIMLLLSLMMMGFFPSIQESSADMQDYINNLPEAFKGMIGGEIDISTINGYLSMELFSFFYPFMVLAFTIMYGSSLIAGEEDSGTLDLLLATPIPRWRVFLDKFLALVVFTTVTLIAMVLGLLIGMPLFGVEGLDVGRTLAATFNMELLGLLFGALALAVTGTQGARGMALGLALGAAAITYLIFVLSDIANLPDALNWLSPWYHYNGPTVMREGLDLARTALMAVLTVIFIVFGLRSFQRRDVGT